MARPKPYYPTLGELDAYLISEGFERQPLGALWKCEVNDNREDDVLVLVEGAAPAGYRIKEL